MLTSVSFFVVGIGNASVVYKAYSFKDGKKDKVAIKKIQNLFDNDERTAQVLREIRILRLLKGHRNVSTSNS